MHGVMDVRMQMIDRILLNGTLYLDGNVMYVIMHEMHVGMDDWIFVGLGFISSKRSHKGEVLLIISIGFV